MAQAPVLQPATPSCCLWHSRPNSSTRRWAHASTQIQSILPNNSKLKHTHQLLEGKPFQRFGSTMLFWALTTPPSNSRIQHCNHTAQKWFPRVHTLLAADRGNP